MWDEPRFALSPKILVKLYNDRHLVRKHGLMDQCSHPWAKSLASHFVQIHPNYLPTYVYVTYEAYLMVSSRRVHQLVFYMQFDPLPPHARDVPCPSWSIFKKLFERKAKSISHCYRVFGAEQGLPFYGFTWVFNLFYMSKFYLINPLLQKHEVFLGARECNWKKIKYK